jgi:hypothetical protein
MEMHPTRQFARGLMKKYLRDHSESLEEWLGNAGRQTSQLRTRPRGDVRPDSV